MRVRSQRLILGMDKGDGQEPDGLLINKWMLINNAFSGYILSYGLPQKGYVLLSKGYVLVSKS